LTTSFQIMLPEFAQKTFVGNFFGFIICIYHKTKMGGILMIFLHPNSTLKALDITNKGNFPHFIIIENCLNQTLSLCLFQDYFFEFFSSQLSFFMQ